LNSGATSAVRGGLINHEGDD
jgi:hypothetical protein